MRTKRMPNFYDAMLQELIRAEEERGDDGWLEPEVANELRARAEWREREPLGVRLNNLRGMTELVRRRPLPRSRTLFLEQARMLDWLRHLEIWAEELDETEVESLPEEMMLAAEKCHFEDAMFAATWEVFDLVERLELERSERQFV